MDHSHEKPQIINLSHKSLTPTQIEILSRGLKFTPTPKKPNIPEIKDDISNFCRRLRLMEQFSTEDNNDESLIKNKTDYQPPKGKNRALDQYCDYISNFPIDEPVGRQIKSNFTKQQWNHLTDLQQDRNVVIKEADKGGSVVIMDYKYYTNIVHNMLQDNTYYEEAKEYKFRKVMKNLTTLLYQYRKCLTDKELDYLTNFRGKTSNFYGLPKIHKSQAINEVCDKTQTNCVNIPAPTDLKLRPIIAGPACETHRLSNFLDILLKPLLKHIRSFIRDDLDFLNHLPSEVNENTYLVSFDVIGLYSNIPHNYGIEAVKYWLDSFPNELPVRIDRQFIIEGLQFVLENNYFLFNETAYRQKSGTAMGTKVAPTFANLVMGYHELKTYEYSSLTYGAEFSGYLKENWKRYLDDCFILWRENHEKLTSFHSLINSINPHIQFTMESSNNKLPFLDILITKTNTKLETDIYFKPTDSRHYLLFSSSHPKHTRINIPFNLARRICTIVSNPGTRNHRLEQMKNILIGRKYPSNLINKSIQKAKAINIQDLRKTRAKKANTVIPYISTFNPKNAEIYTHIKLNLPLLLRDKKMKNVLQQYPVIKSKRQAKSLKSILTNAKLEPPSRTPEVKKCNRANCGVCNYLSEGPLFHFKEGPTFKIRNDFTCDSCNLLYIITCKGCHEHYIGETGMTLRRRMTVHRQQIRTPYTRTIPVSSHIQNCAGRCLPNFEIFPFYQFGTSATVAERINKETYFIAKYKPKLNALTGSN